MSQSYTAVIDVMPDRYGGRAVLEILPTVLAAGRRMHDHRIGIIPAGSPGPRMFRLPSARVDAGLPPACGRWFLVAITRRELATIAPILMELTRQFFPLCSAQGQGHDSPLVVGLAQ